MKRLVAAVVLLGALAGRAEARPAPPRDAHGKAILPIPHEPKHNFVWKLVKYFVVPAAKAAAADLVRGAIVSAL